MLCKSSREAPTKPLCDPQYLRWGRQSQTPFCQLGTCQRAQPRDSTPTWYGWQRTYLRASDIRRQMASFLTVVVVGSLGTSSPYTPPVSTPRAGPFMSVRPNRRIHLEHHVPRPQSEAAVYRLPLSIPPQQKLTTRSQSPGAVMATQPNLESEGQPHPSGKKLINLIRGWPSPHILPTQRIQDATARVLSNPSIAVPALQYGPETGFPPLRKELARWLAPAYGQEFDPARLCITGGASQGLGCILQSFSDPSRTRAVWMAAPCYFLAAPNFQDAGFAGRMKAVPEDEDGIDLEALERGMMAEEENGDPGVEVCRN